MKKSNFLFQQYATIVLITEDKCNKYNLNDECHDRDTKLTATCVSSGF